MSTLSLRIPESLHKKVKELSRKDNISINQFITSALAEKISALLTEEYLEKKAQKGNKEKFMEALSKVPDVLPEAHDQL